MGIFQRERITNKKIYLDGGDGCSVVDDVQTKVSSNQAVPTNLYSNSIYTLYIYIVLL